MKKSWYLFLTIIFLFSLTGCFEKKSDNNKDNSINNSKSSPLMFEVTKNGKDAKIYLLGSIHAADDNMYPISDEIINAYNDSNYLAVEFDLIEYTKNLSAQVLDIQKFMYNDGTNIRDYVDDETYDKMKLILKETKLYSSLYDSYKPVIWETLIENASIVKSGLNTDKGIDLYFLNKAKEDNKNILELESASLQYDILLNLSEEASLLLLNSAIDDFDESIDNLKQLYEAYKRGNKDELESIIFTDEEENELLKEYNEALVTKRNIGMFNRLDNEFKSGKNIFCTVGLAHIIGEDGLVSLFEQNGYTVIQK